MPVLVEAISVIVRNETIVEKFPNGLPGYWMQCPNDTICSDEYITRVGFMVPDDVGTFIECLENVGIRYVENGEYVENAEVAIVDQQDGLTGPCRWITVGDHPDGFRYAALRGDLGDQIAKPAGWKYEDSISETNLKVPVSEMGDMTRLRSGEDGDVYWHEGTQQEVVVERIDDHDPLDELRRQLVDEFGDDTRPLWRVTPRGGVHFVGSKPIRDLPILRLEFPECAFVVAPSVGSDREGSVPPIGISRFDELPIPQRTAMLLLPGHVGPDWRSLRNRWWNPWQWCLRLLGRGPQPKNGIREI